jgi:hypothetical protein
MKKFAVGVGAFLFLIVNQVFAQGELDEQSPIFYRDERTFAILLNSNGYGINYRYGKRMTAFSRSLYDFDLVGIKHPREQKIPTDNFYFSRIVYGKMNEFYNIRGAIGFEKELFSKIDRGGVSIRRYFTFGPSIGLVKPIYYNIRIDGDGDNYFESQIVDKFTRYQHYQASVIVGRASYFKGFKEISVNPGLHGKLGAMFEFGKVDGIIHAIDAGMVFDAFIKKAEIMATEDNKQFFFTLFVSYRFGKVIDARFKQRRNKLDTLIN